MRDAAWKSGMLGRLRALRLQVLSAKTAFRSGESALAPTSVDQAYALLLRQINTGRQQLEL